MKKLYVKTFYGKNNLNGLNRKIYFNFEVQIFQCFALQKEIKTDHETKNWDKIGVSLQNYCRSRENSK